jgi:alkanesulfonate monooxygenase SsuD/methylene tetrahydromethanopterin reductase-like flavin-dependent oxidoreductase (luciferase family)
VKFGIFFEHQLPKPWSEQDEALLYRNALDQAEAADRLGYDYLWEVEHHFLEEYSHSSAPEVFLAAASQRTKRIRLGHGVRLMPSPYNHPARVAEQLATLDLVSGGRVEWGTGTSASRVELDGFSIAIGDRHAMWREATEACVKMLTMAPYPGQRGKFFSMPPRNVVPKPIQKPHPPLWLASATLPAVEIAAKNGMGALAFRPLTAAEARQWVDRYYEVLANECVPIGEAINANVAVVSGFGCAPTREEAVARFGPGLEFYDAALAHYYRFGKHRPGATDLTATLKRVRPFLLREYPAMLGGSPALDTPEALATFFEGYEDAGVDQVSFFHHAGRTRHEDVLEGLELFASVMPRFASRAEAREAQKQRRLEGVFEAAFARKAALPPPEPMTPVEVDAFTRADYEDLLIQLRRYARDI